MLNYEEILERIENSLKGEKIKEFCLEKYQVEPSIFIGLDQENPPDSSLYPVLILAGLNKSSGYSQNIDTYAFSIMMGVYDDFVKQEGSRIEFGGFRAELSLRELVENSLRKNLGFSSSIKTETFFDVVFPYFVSILDVELQLPRNTRVSKN